MAGVRQIKDSCIRPKGTFSVHKIILKRYTLCFTTQVHIDKTAISQPSLYLKGAFLSCLSEMKNDLFVNQGMLWKRNFALLFFLLQNQEKNITLKANVPIYNTITSHCHLFQHSASEMLEFPKELENCSEIPISGTNIGGKKMLYMTQD